MKIKIFIFLFGFVSGIAATGFGYTWMFPQVVVKQEVKKIKNSPGTDLDQSVVLQDTLTRKERRKLKKSLRK